MKLLSGLFYYSSAVICACGLAVLVIYSFIVLVGV